MNEILSWKPILTALALPPVPFLFMMVLAGIRLSLKKAGGWFLILLSTVLMWLSTCQGTSQVLETVLLAPPAALSSNDIQRLKDIGKSKNHKATIVVLGGGLIPRAQEYGMADLSLSSLGRLRYGVWLSQQTGLPIGFSGGLGWAQRQNTSMTEATIAQAVAKEEFNRPLSWIEANSHDTAENARKTIELLQKAGYIEIIIVTEAYHMPRALHEFQKVTDSRMTLTPAPMRFFTRKDIQILDWMPSADGFVQVRQALREWLALKVSG